MVKRMMGTMSTTGALHLDSKGGTRRSTMRGFHPGSIGRAGMIDTMTDMIIDTHAIETTPT